MRTRKVGFQYINIMILRTLTIKLSFALICLCTFRVCSQTPAIRAIARQCSASKLRRHVFILASKDMQGRLFSSHRDTLAARFIAKEFSDAHLTGYFGGLDHAIS
jgi:hypothetical protein